MTDWSEKFCFRAASGREDEDVMLEFVNEHFVPFEPLNIAIKICDAGYR